MCKKFMYVSVLVLLLGLIESVQAAPGDWVSVSSKTGDWMTVAWDGGHAYPGTTEEETALLIDSVITLSAPLPNPLSNVKVGWVINATLTIEADVDFSVVFTTSMGGGNVGATGTMNLYGTHSNGLLQVGNETDGARGVVNVYSGGFLTAGIYGTCNVGNNNPAGYGEINLIGTGSMDVVSPLSILATGHIDIEAGKLRAFGDQRDELAAYIDDGFITGYGGTGTLSDPNFGTGDDADWTVVTAEPAPNTCAGQGVYLPADLSMNCYIDFADFAMFAEYWLLCNDPEDPECTL